MLSRVANNLYWMSRYIERAENASRLADASLQLLMDSPSGADPDAYWRPVLQCTDGLELYAKLHAQISTEWMLEFLVFQPENPNSIRSCVAQARENARTVRDQLTAELWEQINRIHLTLSSDDARERLRSGPQDFLQELRSASLLILGITDATVVRNEGWLFVQAGRYLERADQTSRLLDLRHAAIGGTGALSPEDLLGLAAMLRSCSAWEAYRAEHGAAIEREAIVELLMLSEDFPRSVRFCVQHLDSVLRRISGVREGRFSNDAEKLCGRLLADLRFTTAREILSPGLHDTIDSLQSRLIAVADALFQAYIAQHFALPDDGQLRQQEEQQQQLRHAPSTPAPAAAGKAPPQPR